MAVFVQLICIPQYSLCKLVATLLISHSNASVFVLTVSIQTVKKNLSYSKMVLKYFSLIINKVSFIDLSIK